MQIIYKKIDEVIPYENNPRKNDEAVDYVAKSIKEFGFKVPIIVDKDNIIVTGHTRLKAAKKLGMEEVPVIMADDLTEEQIKAFRLADNKVSEYAEWNFNSLEVELNDILDIDMQDFGFDLGTLDIDNYGTEFSLKDGDRVPIITMSITLSDEQAEVVNEAISQMKKSDTFENYDNEFNKNSNGNAIYLVVSEWLQQRM